VSNSDQETDLITVGEAAEILTITERHCRRLIALGVLGERLTIGYRTVRLHRSAVLRYAAGGQS
jgi:excisionase family DNA binding protein